MSHVECNKGWGAEEENSGGNREIMFNFLHWETSQGPSPDAGKPSPASFAWEPISCG